MWFRFAGGRTALLDNWHFFFFFFAIVFVQRNLFLFFSSHYFSRDLCGARGGDSYPAASVVLSGFRAYLFCVDVCNR